jgi:hypothetical protein
MKFTYYDVELKRMSEQDKELIRYWRNHDKIKSRMAFREYITPEMHNVWFEKFNYFNNAFALIIYYQNNPCGIIYNTNHNHEYSDGGMFIWEDRLLGTQVPVVVSIALSDLNFYLLKQQKAYINILRDNVNAQQFNKWIGYRLINIDDPSYNQRYVLTEDLYKEKSGKIKNMLYSYYGYTSKIKIILEQIDLSNGVYDYFMPFLQTIDNATSSLFEKIVE